VRVIAAGLFAALPALAWADNSPDVALARMLDDVRVTAADPGTCAQPTIDRLVRIFCVGRIRVGVRHDYPLFSTRTGELRQGYEVDVARAIAGKLGVDITFTKVKAATRIAMLADDSTDLVIATMGDNAQRETQARFIRPHYYRSETMLVGPRDLGLADWGDVRGRTVCVSVGNASNAELVSRGARLMLFDGSVALPERLRDQTCTLAAQDDSFFAYYFADPSFAGRFSEKFGFAQMPWGMGVARSGSERLARALDLMSQIFHRDGIFLAAARANHVRPIFWCSSRPCGGGPNATWTLPALTSPAPYRRPTPSCSRPHLPTMSARSRPGLLG
jgi:ABC-type amino acid transport substrate-binding protein